MPCMTLRMAWRLAVVWLVWFEAASYGTARMNLPEHLPNTNYMIWSPRYPLVAFPAVKCA